MSSTEWSRYVRDELGVPLDPGEISDRVVAHVLERYEERLPLLPGAEAAVARIAARWPLALASSSNREVIETVMATSGWGDVFQAWVSSEEVERGKPAPDVFLEAARRIGVEPADGAGIEDSHNGILAARAAGLRVIAIPNHEFPPGEEALAAADVVLGSLDELTPRWSRLSLRPAGRALRPAQPVAASCAAARRARACRGSAARRACRPARSARTSTASGCAASRCGRP